MEQLGRFKVRSELGAGADSVVYDAQDGTQRCALRVLSEGAVPTEPGKRAGLVRALEGLKDIEHPSAVEVLAAGEEAGRLFVAMAFMDCPTIEQKLQDQTRLEELQVVLYTRQIAQALDVARDIGSFHGDLNARNVFVVSEERVKVSDFAVKALIEAPPDIGEFAEEGEGEGAEAREDEWVTAEELLRTKGRKASTERLEDDFIGLGCLMMRMLGVEVPARAEGDPVESYRSALLRGPYDQISSPESGVGMQTAEVVRRLLTPGEFESPGEVVVELASAMLLGRKFGRAREEAPAEVPAAGETWQISAEIEEALEPAPGQPPAVEPAATTTYAPFFLWSDRRGGRFFVVHDGERLTIGRDADLCDVTLRDPAASRKHAFLSREGGVVSVEDADSRNGTFVNGERVQSAELEPGDVLRIGTTQVYLALTSPEL